MTPTPITLDDQHLKELLKQAIRELIQEDQELLSDLISEIIEDIALANAIKQGETTETVSRDTIFNLLDQNHES